MKRINWSDLKIINNWFLENRNEYIAYDTKTIKKTPSSKNERYVLINYKINPVENSWWEVFNNIKKGFNCNHNRVKNVSYDTDSFSNKLKESKPNISLIGDYMGIKNKHQFYCNIHNLYFETTADNCLRAVYACPKCNVENVSIKRTKTQEQFEKDVFDKFGNEFTIVGKYINQDTLIEIKHNECKRNFFTTPNRLLQGVGCKNCRRSFGERVIYKYLKDNNIKNIPEKRFEDCRDKKPLPFDFYLPDHNKIIEFDGAQHYAPYDRFGGLQGYIDTKKRDEIKNEYCQNKNIELIRLPYWDLRNISKILIDNDIV